MRNISRPLPDLTVEEIYRFWSYVSVRGTDDCWPWTGLKSAGGYGKITIKGRTILAHRLALFIHTGVDPAPLLACHSCDERYAIGDISYRVCCNGNHLFPATNAGNSLDMALKGRAATGDRNGSRLYPDMIMRGSRNGNSRLVDADIAQIRDLHEYGFGQRHIAELYGVGKTTIARVILRKCWAHLV